MKRMICMMNGICTARDGARYPPEHSSCGSNMQHQSNESAIAKKRNCKYNMFFLIIMHFKIRSRYTWKLLPPCM